VTEHKVGVRKESAAYQRDDLGDTITVSTLQQQ